MPTPAEIAYHSATFRNFHAAEWAWLQAHTDSLVGTSFATTGQCSVEDTQLVRRTIEVEAELGPEVPAEAWHAVAIPNGDYKVKLISGFETQQFYFRIHLVESGQLAGQRIIKVKRDGESIYKGFGFITRGGSFSLWRRFQGHALLDYVRAARLLVETVNRSVASLRVGSEYELDGGWFTLTDVRCSLCNIRTTIRIAERRNLYLCPEHSEVPPRPAPPRREPSPRRRSANVSESGVFMCEVTGKFVR